MRIGLALALAAAGTAAASPATNQTLSIGDGNPEDRIAYERWATALRPCTRAEVASAKRPIPDDLGPLVKRRQPVTVRGSVVPGIADCALIGWTRPTCGNGCSFDWVLLPRRECPLWRFAIRRAGQYFRLQGNGTDCGVHTFGSQAAEVILTGHLEGKGHGVEPASLYVVVTTDMCRVAEASQRLTDADLDELSAPPTSTQRATQKCPPVPRTPPPVPQPKPAGPGSQADQLNL
jgi:hypothetical protein